MLTSGACASSLAVTVFGAPGSGKGTIAGWMSEEHELAHVSTGDLLRDALGDAEFVASEKGKAIKATIEAGNLVGDDTILDLVEPIVGEKDRLILDGFPRNIHQAKALDAMRRIDYCLDIDVPADEIVARLSARRVHPGSGRIYHLTFSPPKEEGLDDLTGEPLVQRQDDKEDVIRNRLEKFNDLKAPLLEYYAVDNRVISVAGTESKVIYPALVEALTTLKAL